MVFQFDILKKSLTLVKHCVGSALDFGHFEGKRFFIFVNVQSQGLTTTECSLRFSAAF